MDVPYDVTFEVQEIRRWLISDRGGKSRTD